MLYFLEEFPKTGRNKMWKKILNYAFKEAEFMEFNVLYHDSALTKALQSIASIEVKSTTDKFKLYGSDETIRVSNDANSQKFILSKEYEQWYNYCLEDLSFFSGGVEFIATITHEDYIIVASTPQNTEFFSSLGFTLECEWKS